MTKNPYKGADSFTVRAKREGYPARSVFKLEEIDRRVKLFRPGQKVLDLGAAPGSWSLYAAQKIGKNGRLLAMDLKPLDTVLPEHATFSQGDALSLSNEQLALYAPYDVIVSDMAPATTGNRNADQARSFELYMRALTVAEALLAPGGHFVGKIFMGEDFSAAKAATKKAFREERTIRPEGTRSVSYEVFLIGLGRTGVAAPRVEAVDATSPPKPAKTAKNPPIDRSEADEPKRKDLVEEAEHAPIPEAPKRKFETPVRIPPASTQRLGPSERSEGGGRANTQQRAPAKKHATKSIATAVIPQPVKKNGPRGRR